MPSKATTKVLWATIASGPVWFWASPPALLRFSIFSSCARAGAPAPGTKEFLIASLEHDFAKEDLQSATEILGLRLLPVAAASFDAAAEHRDGAAAGEHRDGTASLLRGPCSGETGRPAACLSLNDQDCLAEKCFCCFSAGAPAPRAKALLVAGFECVFAKVFLQGAIEMQAR